ncbi:hypothetical protein EW026_g930 [Hermanssonia centrifuga]|uniref:Uncharacterized protein n=1 Tax=Hermanssonia centrifuga TaxID=98765 RepID=A0A4S4KU88_9APHY|nr:hypothetical protein EW026_g930 [Hermanssonia centrifuga]
MAAPVTEGMSSPDPSTDLFKMPYHTQGKRFDNERDALQKQLTAVNNHLTQVMSGMDQINIQISQPGGPALLSEVGFPDPALLSRADYPQITYWSEDDWSNHCTKGVTKADGTQLGEAEWKTMRRMTRAVFTGLKKPAPESWIAHSSMKQRVAVYNELIYIFPYLGLCNGYWKVEKYCINQYPLWKNARKDGSGNSGVPDQKRKAEDENELTTSGGAQNKAPQKMRLKKKKAVSPVETTVSNPLLGMTKPLVTATITATVQPPAATSNAVTIPEDIATIPGVSAILPLNDTVTTPTGLPTIAGEHGTNNVEPPAIGASNDQSAKTAVSKARSQPFKPGPKHTARNVYGRTWVLSHPKGTSAKFTKAWNTMTKVQKKVHELEAKALTKVRIYWLRIDEVANVLG